MQPLPTFAPEAAATSPAVDARLQSAVCAAENVEQRRPNARQQRRKYTSRKHLPSKERERIREAQRTAWRARNPQRIQQYVRRQNQRRKAMLLFAKEHGFGACLQAPA